MAINAEHASEILRRIFNREDPSEQITLISGKDKRRVSIHRVILTASSKYFGDLLGPNFQEAKPNEFLLTDSDGETIKTVVDFCYTGNIDLTEENVEKILEIASEFEIDSLEVKCRQFNSAKPNVANAVELLSDDFETSLDLVNTEYGKRTKRQCHTIEDAPTNVIFCVFSKFKGEDSTNSPASVTIEKYENMTQCFELVVEIPMGERNFFSPVYSAHQNKLFFVGGYAHDQNKFLATLTSYDLTTGKEETWKDMDVARSNTTTVAHEKYIYVIGGQNFNLYTRTCERYDTELNSWETLSPMSTRICYSSCIVWDNCIYIVGGHDSLGTFEETVYYNILTNKWKSVGEMKFPRNHCALIEKFGFLYAIGFERLIERFELDPDPEKGGKWKIIGRFPESRKVTHSVPFGDNVYAIMRDGHFGRIVFRSADQCVFAPICQSRFRSLYLGRHYLYHV